ncbi:hypothetical protein DFP80_11561 [Marinomonas rhizomae]|uniref:Uncharacterized protein n=1 Tax=Marinomonas rhizomae TaxID=491948 RepID=A0A366IZI8_9GAMM|nr:hypothetical protein DFP80_11561 [Marinomonas rhizomae]
MPIFSWLITSELTANLVTKMNHNAVKFNPCTRRVTLSLLDQNDFTYSRAPLFPPKITI